VGNNPEKIREEILSLIAHHVTAVNYIYRDTRFDGRLEHRNIKFEVQRIKVSVLSFEKLFTSLVTTEICCLFFRPKGDCCPVLWSELSYSSFLISLTR